MPVSSVPATRKKRWSIHAQLNLLVVVVAIPLVFGFLYEVAQDVDVEFRRTGQMVLRLTRMTAADTERLLRESERLLAVIARQPSVRAMGAAGCDPLFQRFRDMHPRYANLLLVDVAGNLICSAAPPRFEATGRLQQIELLDRVRKQPELAVGQPGQDHLSGKWVVPLGYPVYDRGGNMVGMVGVAVDLVSLHPLADLAGAEVPQGTVFAIVNGDGVVIARSLDPESTVGRNHSASPVVRVAIESKSGTARTVDEEGVERIVGFLPIAGADWYALTTIPLSPMRAAAIRLVLERGAYTLVVVFVALFFARRVGRRIEGPIERIAEAVRLAERQPWAVRAPEDGAAELVEVASRFNHTLDVLQQERHSLQESKERFRAIVESSPVPLVIIGKRDGRVLYANEDCLRAFGLSRQEVIGRRSLSFCVDPAVHATTLRHIRRKGGFGALEMELKRADGSTFWTVASARTATFDGVSAVFVGLSDISDRKRIERTLKETAAALKKSEARLAGTIASAMDAVISVDARQRIVLFNPAAEGMFGYAARDILGRPVHVLLPESLQAAHRRDVGRYVRDGVTSRRMGALGRVSGRRADGGEFPVEASISRLEVGGEVILTVILRDITERVRDEQAIRDLTETLEQRVAERTDQLQRANQELEAFSYSVSHDLRAPLRAINGFAAILADNEGGSLSDEGRQLLERVRHNALRMGQLIDDILRFSRIARSELVMKDVDMGRLAAQVAEELREHYPAAEVVVGAMPGARGDPAMLRQVYSNLVGNALKFSSKADNPRVELGAERIDGAPVYYVKDNGAGFDLSYAGKLFGVFQRLHKDSDYGGTGVGLAIVKRIVERHGGRVWAEAVPQRGASFYFTLGTGD